MTQVQNKEKKPLSIKVKVLILLGIFVVVAIGLLWLLQSVFVNDVYGFVKTNSVRAYSKAIENSINDNFDEDVLLSIVNNTGVCSIVYKVENGEAEQIASAHVNDECAIHSLKGNSNDFFNRMYQGAKKSSDYYFDRVSFDMSGGKGKLPPQPGDNANMFIVCSKLKVVDGVEYLIITNSEFRPVSSTVNTLTYQLILVTAILLVVAVIIGIIVSRSITKPLVKMNEEAKKLAEGNYDVDFTSKSFRETEDLGKTLNYAASELSKLDEMQKELIANISHDLRTPLTMISGYSEVMRDIPGENTPENVQVIIDETARLSSLVNDLLEVSKINGSEQKLNLEKFSITETVDEVIKRYDHLVKRDGYDITFEADVNIFVFADKIRILQVIYNLVNNAINFTGEDKKVVIKQTVIDNKVRISIIDDGCGIAEEELPKVWEKYYRTQDFHKRAVTGSGLGLTIVKSCLDLHGATYGVVSQVGKGSTFWFELEIYTD